MRPLDETDWEDWPFDEPEQCIYATLEYCRSLLARAELKGFDAHELRRGVRCCEKHLDRERERLIEENAGPDAFREHMADFYQDKER